MAISHVVGIVIFWACHVCIQALSGRGLQEADVGESHQQLFLHSGYFHHSVEGESVGMTEIPSHWTLQKITTKKLIIMMIIFNVIIMGQWTVMCKITTIKNY
jgi:hypothetical protein